MSERSLGGTTALHSSARAIYDTPSVADTRMVKRDKLSVWKTCPFRVFEMPNPACLLESLIPKNLISGFDILAQPNGQIVQPRFFGPKYALSYFRKHRD